MMAAKQCALSAVPVKLYIVSVFQKFVSRSRNLIRPTDGNRPGFEKQKVSNVQEIHLELIKRASRDDTMDSEQVVASLLKHRELWVAVMLALLNNWLINYRSLLAQCAISSAAQVASSGDNAGLGGWL